ncbi:MAG: transposase, partial [Pseudomonadales bacterium]
MSRPLRIELPGANYHVTSRGKDGQTVFKDKEDFGVFLNTVEHVVDRFGWLLHSYVLMKDHY